MVELTFTNPAYLWTLLLIPFIILTHIFTLRHIRTDALKFSNFEAIERVSKGAFLGKPYKGLFINKNIFLLFLRLVIYILLILSVTGTTVWYAGKSSNFDFIIAIDSSISMLAEDYNITRLEAAKEAAEMFVDSITGRSTIGIISFASSVFVDQEPASDTGATKQIIRGMSIKEGGGSNIGDAVITSTNLLMNEDREKSKVIILLTDGQSNIGTPIDVAIEYAKNRAVIIHTIGMGTEEGASFLGLDVITKLDEDGLKDIAARTSGKYFRAENMKTLKGAFEEIASFTEKRLSLDISWILLIIALGILAIEWILVHTVYKTIP